MTKQTILAALRAFLATRPGFDFGNYSDRASFLSEMRQATRQRNDAERFLRDIELRDSISWQDIFDATRGGRIDMHLIGDGCSVGYTAGQYYPLEYRAAVARLAASVLWAWKRDHAMPEGSLRHNSETGETLHRYGPQELRAGDWLRASFAREYGRGLAARYFT